MKQNQKRSKSKKKLKIKKILRILEIHTYLENMKEKKYESIFRRLNFFAYKKKKKNF